MKILKSKWKNAAESPVIFMIDDLANKYINLNNSETNIIGCDWGAKTIKENSFYSILKRYQDLDNYHGRLSLYYLRNIQPPLYTL